MMNIEDSNLEEIESLLSQSLRGFHHLFDNQSIAEVLKTPTEELDFFTFDNMDKIQSLFTGLIEQRSLEDKHDYLSDLDEDSYELLLRTYFHLVENTMLSASELKH